MTINCKGELIDLNQPRVMGILNCTPDSFYDGGKYPSVDKGVAQALKMLEEGADFIDIGGYSSRPGAADISASEEADRILPVIESLLKKQPGVLISVDTFRAEVARVALEAGAALINDISGGVQDPQILAVALKYQVPIILMHMRGTPQNMQQNTDYENLVEEVILYFSERLSAARKQGISDILIDPGFGFSKTREQNFQLLGGLSRLKILEVPILAGVSRKSMIYKTLGIPAEQALNGSTALHMMCLNNGANILRVHDVAQAVECVKLFNEIPGNPPGFQYL